MAFGIIPGSTKAVEIDGALFTVASLTARQLAPLQDAFIDMGETRTVSKLMALHAAVVKAGLRGWGGMRHADGSALPYAAGEGNAPSEADIDALPGDLLAKVSAAIMEANTVTGADLGN